MQSHAQSLKDAASAPADAVAAVEAPNMCVGVQLSACISVIFQHVYSRCKKMKSESRVGSLNFYVFLANWI